MLNGLYIQRWQRICIEKLIEEGATPVLLITPADSPRPAKKKLRTLLYRAYLRFRFRPEMLTIEDLPESIDRVPILESPVEEKGHSQYFPEEHIKKVKEENLDFILRFGFNIIRGEMLNAAKHGIWSFHHGDEEEFRGGPAGFWEIYYGKAVTGSILQRLTEKLDGGEILKKGWFKTVDHSYREQVDQLLGATAEWPADVLRSGQMEGTTSSTDAYIFKYPKNLEFLKFWFKKAGNKMQFTRHNLFRAEQWRLALYDQKLEDVVEKGLDPKKRKWSSPVSRDTHFLADPFGTDDALLYESFDYHTYRGIIAGRAELNNKTFYLNKTYHLSYPYTFKYKDEWYVIPESSNSGKTEIYKLTDNYDLEHIQTLLDFPAGDPSVVEHDGKFWLFCTELRNSNTHLHIFYADDLFGRWSPHAANPVKIDVRSARPAGHLFHKDGVLYRPGQDSSERYGGAIVINEIEELSPSTFKEKQAQRLEPTHSLFNKGIHTISRYGEGLITDEKRHVFVWVNLRRKLFSKRK